MNDIQKVILEIFRSVAFVCENNNIDYYAIGGTCLGAVRHKGFIPWDDDMDIAIPVEDYRRFIDAAKNELPDYLEIYTPGDAEHNMLPFLKVVDTRTAFIEGAILNYKDRFTGIWLDVMPLSGFPSKKIGRKMFFLKRRIIFTVAYKTKFGIRGQKKIIWLLMYPLRFVLKKNSFWNQWLDFLEKYPFYKSDFTGYVWSGNLYRLIFPRKWFDGFVLLDFEDMKIRCPAGYDGFLTQMFGNYMELPPENERLGHVSEGTVIDLEHSYKDYQFGKIRLESFGAEK